MLLKRLMISLRNVKFRSIRPLTNTPASSGIDEIARQTVPHYPSDEEIKAREWDKPQWERKDRNYIHYGFDFTDAKKDELNFKTFLFLVVSLGVVLNGFAYKYMADPSLKVWSYREAFLELARRESAGLPLVDPNYVPEDRIVLPTEEELGDTEIII